MEIVRLSDTLYEIPPQGGMRVPGRIYANEKLMESIRGDQSVVQVANVAHLPGIVGHSLAMPDIHWGYGFPIGGVAAMDASDGVISPGGVGYDINCGVRLLSTNLLVSDVEPRKKELVSALFKMVPTGLGSEGAIKKLAVSELKKLTREGVEWAVSRGYGTEEDIATIEENGRLDGADPDAVSERAMMRGLRQIGTLGSGNHFLELEEVAEIFYPEAAETMGLRLGGLAMVIHCGSRGFGYQICDDSLRVIVRAMEKYDILLPDRQLACVPIGSKEGKNYIAAMRCAANYAWVNRQVITHLMRKAFETRLRMSPKTHGIRIVYDVCHNIAKFEKYEIDGREVEVCVHRKGATRAFPAEHPQVPEVYRKIGQPVLVPGSMGTGSYVLVGLPGAMEHTFGSTCHGAGRMMSRKKSSQQSKGMDLFKEMEKIGVLAMARGRRTMAEEMPHAYKEVGEVVDVMDKAGISRKVARLRPIGVIKG